MAVGLHTSDFTNFPSGPSYTHALVCILFCFAPTVCARYVVRCFAFVWFLLSSQYRTQLALFSSVLGSPLDRFLRTSSVLRYLYSVVALFGCCSFFMFHPPSHPFFFPPSSRGVVWTQFPCCCASSRVRSLSSLFIDA